MVYVYFVFEANSILPCILIHLDGHERVFHGLVDECVYAGYEKVDGAQQSLSVLTQQFLSFCVVAKFILEAEKNNPQTVFFSNNPHNTSICLSIFFTAYPTQGHRKPRVYHRGLRTPWTDRAQSHTHWTI